MDPQRRKATRTASKAKAASPEVSARSQGTRTKPAPRKPTPTDPSERPVAPEAAGPKKQNCGPTRPPGPPRRKSAANLQAARAREARIEKARSFLNAEDALDGPAGLAEEPAPPGAPEPPLPGSSGRPTAGLGQDPWVPAPSPGHGVSAPGSWKPVAVLRKLKLKSEEISEAANVVNTVVDHLLQRMQSLQSEFKGVQLLPTGSYYERVKVANPNEFDVMFKLDVPRIDLEEYRNSGAHYLVRFKRNPKGNPLSEFIEEGMLSASKMLSKFRKIIKEEIKKIEAIDVIVEKKKRGCPAVTLLIRKPKEISVDLILALTVRSSWPASTLEGLPIRNWLGSKVRTDLRRQPFYLVPKHAKEGRGFQGETWRLSFSHVEKYILKNHGTSKTCCEKGRVKCCRKDCLKLMKYLLEQLKKKFQDRKEVDDFCSYHMKTAFFHICSQDPEDSQWQARDVKFCFDRCVAYFLQCLETECLTNFFIPGVNQFSRDKIDKISKEFLLKQIEYERNNGYPVFSEF